MVSLENPDTSMIWQVPRMLQLLQHPSATMHRFCMCKFGTRWRKATRIAVWHGRLTSLEDGMCSGRLAASTSHQEHQHQQQKQQQPQQVLQTSGARVCRFTGRPHIVLSGRDRVSGRSWTAIAGAYPVRMARAVASNIVDCTRFPLQRMTQIFCTATPV